MTTPQTVDHEPYSVVAAMSRNPRTGALTEGRKMHLIPAPFTTEVGRITPERLAQKVRTLCGATITPGNSWRPDAWQAARPELARAYQTGHCLRCLARDPRARS